MTIQEPRDRQVGGLRIGGSRPVETRTRISLADPKAVGGSHRVGLPDQRHVIDCGKPLGYCAAHDMQTVVLILYPPNVGEAREQW